MLVSVDLVSAVLLREQSENRCEALHNQHLKFVLSPATKPVHEGPILSEFARASPKPPQMSATVILE
jgi:hypothetical protein